MFNTACNTFEMFNTACNTFELAKLMGGGEDYTVDKCCSHFRVLLCIKTGEGSLEKCAVANSPAFSWVVDCYYFLN